ncbi:TPA: hypothetical protein N0F65_004234 [Lagenidium giganteum]|uniref:Uncharacterized protein n=1 Tax=Lagenidium giganteum TaxID=4803 RepID=A0AAV2ZCS9_9STRA|nr:TPA: hypothetical protein N0F65_004234 [Lagenidium giganteum]
MLREAIEVITQINQAYYASVLVSHRYINQLLVVMRVVNCWSTPTIHYAMKMHRPQTSSSRALARVTCLVGDAILHVVYGCSDGASRSVLARF